MFLFDEFLREQYEWLEDTKTTAKWHLGQWAKWLNGDDIQDVTIAQFETWTRDWSASARYNSLWSIRAWLNAAGQDGHVLLKHKVVRRMPPMGRYHKLREVRAMVETCELSTPAGLQEATLVSFFWETWARAKSVITAELRYLDLEAQEVQLHVKGDHWHTPVFGPDLKALLELWIEAREQLAIPGTKTIFVNPYRGTPMSYYTMRRILIDLGKRAGVRDVQAHAFRRGAARHHASNEGSDRQGMEQGGWKSFASYWRYTRGVSLEPFKHKRWMDNEH